MTLDVETLIDRNAHRPGRNRVLFLLVMILAVVVALYRNPARWVDALFREIVRRATEKP